MQRQRELRNPYNICTFRPVSECKDCTIAGRLKCRLCAGELIQFLALFACFFIPALVGMIAGGYGWYLTGWFAFMIVFFGFWEIRILCSHCPYYAQEGPVLHCIANYGCPKFWKFRPGPMTNPEKGQLFCGLLVLFGYPFPFMFIAGQWILLSASVMGGTIFFMILNKYTCTQCINFSCPLNSVPKPLVDEYLRRNPVMREAWERSGWKLEDTKLH